MARQDTGFVGWSRDLLVIILCSKVIHAVWNCNRLCIALIIGYCWATFYVVKIRLSVFRKAMRPALNSPID